MFASTPHQSTVAKLVLAPTTIVSTRGGRLCVEVHGSTMPPLQTDQPGLIGWLCRFISPQTLDSMLAELPPQARPVAARASSYLLEMGALRIAEDHAPHAHDREALHAENRACLSQMMQMLYELACDVGGLGPFAQDSLESRDGIGLDARLASLRHAMSALRAELSTLRQPHLSRQLSSQGIGPESIALKLHIGCGPCHLAGWVNLDIYPAPVATNVLWGLPFVDGSARYVFLSHLLEHLFYPNDVQPFLEEIHRVLMPGGVLRIIVPDIEACIEAYQQRDAAFFAGRRRHWGGGDGAPTRLEDFLAYAGAGPDPAWLFEAHKFGYDFETLSRALQRAGFAHVRRCGFMGSAHPELQVDSNSEVADAHYGDRHYSLFVEATRAG
jgi:SAM-dependent methyltransferase